MFHLHGGMYKISRSRSRSRSISHCRGMSYGSHRNISAVGITLVDANCVSGCQQGGECHELEKQERAIRRYTQTLCGESIVTFGEINTIWEEVVVTCFRV
jgi:hypothetical protein